VRLFRWLLLLVVMLLAASAVAAVGLVAVEGETDVAGGTPMRVAPWPRCSNKALRYSIAYPRGWHRDWNCAFFDPKPFTVPANSDFYGVSLEVQVAQTRGRTSSAASRTSGTHGRSRAARSA